MFDVGKPQTPELHFITKNRVISDCAYRFLLIVVILVGFSRGIGLLFKILLLFWCFISSLAHVYFLIDTREVLD